MPQDHLKTQVCQIIGRDHKGRNYLYFPSHADCRIYMQEGKTTKLFLQNIDEVESFLAETCRNKEEESLDSHKKDDY